MSAPAAAHAVSPAVTGAHFLLLGAMIAALALEEKLHAKKSVVTGAAAVLALLLGAATGVLPGGDAGGHGPFYALFVDWEVVAVILGSSLFVDISTKSGIFTWLAIRLTKATGGDPLRLLVCYAAMTVLFSALLNNVTAMIVVGSLTAVSLRRLERGELLLGFLLCEGLLTNVGGLLTLISSVPNIIVGGAAGITFLRFLAVSTPFVLIATAITVWMAARIFGIASLPDEAAREAAAARIADFDENDGIGSRAFFVLSWVLFGAFILALATNNLIPVLRDLGIGFVAMAFGVAMLLKVRGKADATYRALDWDLMLFFVFLFAVIGVMEHTRVLAVIGRGVLRLMGLGEAAGPLALLWSSSAASAVTDNIPLAAMLAKTMAALEPPLGSDSSYWWALIYGANLGGNLTPIGSASTVVAVTVMHKHGLELSFAGFVGKALPFALAQLLLASAYVHLLGRLL